MSGLFGDFVLVGSNTQNGNDVDDKTFDYVTVRGGTSGLVVANRLIEDRRSKSTLHVFQLSSRR